MCLYVGCFSRLAALARTYRPSRLRSNVVQQTRRLRVLVFLGERLVGGAGDVLSGNFLGST